MFKFYFSPLLISVSLRLFYLEDNCFAMLCWSPLYDIRVVCTPVYPTGVHASLPCGPPPTPALGLSPGTRLSPELHSSFPLAVCFAYGNVHVEMQILDSSSEAGAQHFCFNKGSSKLSGTLVWKALMLTNRGRYLLAMSRSQKQREGGRFLRLKKTHKAWQLNAIRDS